MINSCASLHLAIQKVCCSKLHELQARKPVHFSIIQTLILLFGPEKVPHECVDV